jgi:hypothetical protein
MAGLSLLHGGAKLELRLPVFFCRHVYKFLLGRQITFADYAYYDEKMHAQMVRALETGVKDWGLEWDTDVGCTDAEPRDVEEEGPWGCRAYVEARWKWAMVGSVQLELDALRDGLYDVVPPEELRDLTADDLQVWDAPAGL